MEGEEEVRDSILFEGPDVPLSGLVYFHQRFHECLAAWRLLNEDWVPGVLDRASIAERKQRWVQLNEIAVRGKLGGTMNAPIARLATHQLELLSDRGIEESPMVAVEMFVKWVFNDALAQQRSSSPRYAYQFVKTVAPVLVNRHYTRARRRMERLVIDDPQEFPVSRRVLQQAQLRYLTGRDPRRFLEPGAEANTVGVYPRSSPRENPSACLRSDKITADVKDSIVDLFGDAIRRGL